MVMIRKMMVLRCRFPTQMTDIVRTHPSGCFAVAVSSHVSLGASSNKAMSGNERNQTTATEVVFVLG